MKAQYTNSRPAITVSTRAVTAIVTESYSWDMSNAEDFAIQTEWGDDLTGTFQLWERSSATAEWVENTVISFTNPAKDGATVSKAYDNIDAVSPFWKISFTYTSGITGPLYVWVHIK